MRTEWIEKVFDLLLKDDIGGGESELFIENASKELNAFILENEKLRAEVARLKSGEFCAYDDDGICKHGKKYTEVEKMNCKEIITKYLKENNYDGLAGDECGCGVDDLMPCEGNFCDCEPAMLGKNADGEEIFVTCDLGGKK